MSPTGAWTPERADMLRDLASRGFSAGEIARELTRRAGHEFTRNMVIGKASRLRLKLLGAHHKGGVPIPPRPTRKRKVRHGAAAPRIAMIAPQPAPRAAAPAAAADPVPKDVAWLAIPESRSVSLIDLAPGQCRWPLWDDPGDADKRFCGADCRPSLSYCPRHAATAIGPGTLSERRATEIERF